MLTEAEVNHIAKLARIELSEELKEKMKKDLSSILGYIEQLEKVDVANAQPLYQVTGLQNQARPDTYRNDWPMTEELKELLVDQAPHHEDRYLKIKSVKAK